MDTESLKQLLTDVKNGKTSVNGAVEQFKGMPFDDIGFAKIDNHRHLRCGFPEAIFCQGKDIGQIIAIIGRAVTGNNNILATRANDEIYHAVKEKFPNAVYNAQGKTITISKHNRRKKNKGSILIVSAGTSDIPVAEEAKETAKIMGNKVDVLYDVGVAGIHRLLYNRNELASARVIVVVAGMEGALASVVGGLVNCPVIAVPTSVGYGSSFGGVAALLSMLNSCSACVSVVNIDNGFGAGCVASLINQS